MKQKKIPLRMCVGCSERKEKSQLVRVVRSPEGTVSLDFSGKAAGRGAYICRNADCLKKAVKSKRFENAFGVSIDPSVIEKIEEELKNAE